MIIVVEVGKPNRMAHLVVESLVWERRAGAFELKVKGIDTLAVDGHRVTHRVVREKLHVGPQQLSPAIDIALHDN